jgi:hypothetical protein
MEKKKIHIVVSGGRVESVFSEDDIEVDIIDFDSSDAQEDQWPLCDYVDTLRANLKEVVC